jgi:hypothetical protein
VVRGGGELGARVTRQRGEPDLGEKGVGKLTGKALHGGGGSANEVTTGGTDKRPGESLRCLELGSCLGRC